jgi:FKBP-type peptidyl-prolyl cis-trans isomerase FkpA
MITAPSRAARFAMLVSAALLAVPALAAPVKAMPRPAARPAAVAALSSAILPVPLMPIVPAGQRQCSAKTASGLGTLTLKPATDAAHPAKGDYVLVNYIGYLAADGRVFDQNAGAAFPVEGVIPGFSEGLQLMAKGSTWRFCVPATLGYGAQGAGETIPANADLVFQVELVDYKTADEVAKMRAAASAAQPGGEQPAAPAPAPKP